MTVSLGALSRYHSSAYIKSPSLSSIRHSIASIFVRVLVTENDGNFISLFVSNLNAVVIVLTRPLYRVLSLQPNSNDFLPSDDIADNNADSKYYMTYYNIAF